MKHHLIPPFLTIAGACRVGFAISAAVLAGLGRAAEEPRPAALETLFQQCREACVEVLVDGRHAGSAWFATADGVAVSAAHLFERGRPSLEFLFADNHRADARLVAVDRGHDLALLQAEPGAAQGKFLPLARRTPGVGEALYQYGAPVFRSGLLQPGRVASPEPRFEFSAAVVDYAEVVASAAMMQGGTSGGPWLNRRGEVVGVQSSILSLDGKPAGLAFFGAAPAIRHLLDTRQSATTATAGLGVDELWQQSAEFLARLPKGLEGLVVSVVREGGPAAGAGVQPGDVLVTAAGQPLVRIADLPRAVRRHAPGAAVELKLLRPGETAYRQARVVLDRAEDVWPGEPGASAGPNLETP